MRIALGLILLLGGIVGGSFFWKALKSRSEAPQVGLENGRLLPCPDKPNCVCSHEPESNPHGIGPFKFSDNKAAWQRLRDQATSFGLSLVSESEHYMHFTTQTPLMKFTDDVEFLFDHTQDLIHVRSASRVGYSDLGANRKRVETLRAQLGRNL